MTLPKKFLADPDYTFKTLRWVIAVEIITTIAFVLFFVITSNKTTQVAIDPELTKEMRKANEEYRNVLIKSDQEKKRLIQSLDKRDSLLQAEMIHNMNTIKNERKKYDEKINHIDQYVNADLQREFAKLTDSIRK